jgi:hypothetical protein
VCPKEGIRGEISVLYRGDAVWEGNWGSGEMEKIEEVLKVLRLDLENS